MTRVGFILKQGTALAPERATDLFPALRRAGHTVVVLREDDAPAGDLEVDEASFAEAVDLAIVLGGDGTMLRASRILGDGNVPVLGINLGHLGFLAPFEPNHATRTIEDAIAGRMPTTRRMRLRVELRPRKGEPESWTALNDVVVHQGAVARLLELNASVDDSFIASYRADGIIVATPTGSTAYNLAAGGPILLPTQRAMCLTPICAHALTMRPLVLAAGSRLSITPGGVDDVSLTIDGYWSRPVAPGDHLQVTEAEAPLIVFDAPGRSTFDILREKMHWGVRERSGS